MPSNWGRVLAAAWIVAAASAARAVAGEHVVFISVGDSVRAPIGWVQFCNTRPLECNVVPSLPRHIVLTPSGWKDLVLINQQVNERIRPMTDLEHYGVDEKWAYPDDGYGDCEDYVLLKRRTLMEVGWPREALLITMVRAKNGDAHAVLTVKTDLGEFVLDNQTDQIVLWWQTSYRFVERQSQSDPNAWISLASSRDNIVTAASLRERTQRNDAAWNAATSPPPKAYVSPRGRVQPHSRVSYTSASFRSYSSANGRLRSIELQSDWSTPQHKPVSK